MTLEELKVRLAKEFDEVTILELLNVDSEQLVELLHDEIEKNFNKLVREVDEEEWQD